MTHRPDLRGARWSTVRRFVLARDDFRCQLVLDDRCSTFATQVDHIDEVALHGASYDPDRLRASCAHCNAVLAGRLARRIQTGAVPSRRW